MGGGGGQAAWKLRVLEFNFKTPAIESAYEDVLSREKLSRKFNNPIETLY
jgi:hypothetical protein